MPMVVPSKELILYWDFRFNFHEVGSLAPNSGWMVLYVVKFTIVNINSPPFCVLWLLSDKRCRLPPMGVTCAAGLCVGSVPRTAEPVYPAAAVEWSCGHPGPGQGPGHTAAGPRQHLLPAPQLQVPAPWGRPGEQPPPLCHTQSSCVTRVNFAFFFFLVTFVVSPFVLSLFLVCLHLHIFLFCVVADLWVVVMADTSVWIKQSVVMPDVFCMLVRECASVVIATVFVVIELSKLLLHLLLLFLALALQHRNLLQ